MEKVELYALILLCAGAFLAASCGTKENSQSHMQAATSSEIVYEVASGDGVSGP